MNHRYFIYLSYNGKNYHGWQIQPNGISVQEVLEKALETVLRYKVEVTGAGRTDAGVHARLMVAHIDVQEAFVDPEAFAYKINGILPNDIAIQKIVPVKPDAHARFDAVSRRYEYWLVTEKNPFLWDWTAKVYGELDFSAMNRAAGLLLDYEDFTSFSKLHTDVKTNNCNISQAKWEQRGEVWVFTIQADRFLRNMVRAIVGTLLQVGRGQLDENGFRTIIEAKDRCQAGTSAPAEGLYLVDVEYPKELFIN
jgi:tRNA pseudouridine38-40 synthase